MDVGHWNFLDCSFTVLRGQPFFSFSSCNQDAFLKFLFKFDGISFHCC